jgi:uncharacterized membrane protein
VNVILSIVIFGQDNNHHNVVISFFLVLVLVIYEYRSMWREPSLPDADFIILIS